MQKYLSILKQYWGYDEFRPLQTEIIESVVSGRDTLGLMPTGGGKSLTFQVPAMAMEGVCIVITPLIALMKDQVENLKRRNIQAAAIYTGMTHSEIVQTLDNTVFEAYKFLYVSPERLGTEIFLNKVKQMKVCLLAVDEAHCISQWGYDFRPSYLKIAEIREFLPNVPVLALTATATPEVVEDIQTQLCFPQKNVFQKSFHRKNLAYVVRNTEKKNETLLKVLEGVKGTSVVYVRNRKKTKEIADFLTENGISAEHFHAGLNNKTKDERQNRWKSGETRVIVCTNAFGMGIDKPDVRSVVHIDLPDTLEAYFQEAGRAGRDEKKAFAVLLYNKTDETKLKKRIADTFPPKETVKDVYEALGNYFTLAVGAGLYVTFPFDLADFCGKFHFPLLVAYNSIKILQQAGYLELTDEEDSASMVLFTIKKDDLYNLKNTPEQEQLIHILLRSYTGLFTDLHAIHEETLCTRLDWTHEKLYQTLVSLSNEKIIKYIPRKKTPFLTFTHERDDISRLALTKEAYDDRKEKYIERVNSVLRYANEENICRSRILLSYFGEKNTKDCGVCDICLKKKETQVTEEEFQNIRKKINELLNEKSRNLSELTKNIKAKEPKIIHVIRFMMDNNEILMDDVMKYRIS
ncbi:ATP-dependent DNA helicase RecQ [uncultured Paludibacter sp.]|uniref:ATP-dependent DNA helicase RecQ n=1 Tax=uncultured Paludibacter sp. TaxID=497635 RepID=A0A653A9R8_9BACT|nr:ATP-dependent DNA helicase RecQ [uncultured Paludibacter sp.]